MEIVPAILTDDRDEFVKMLRQAEQFAKTIQIDIMDGKFVPSKSITRRDLEGLSCHCFSEAHLMANDPFSWVSSFKRFGAKRIVFHFEIKEDKEELINKIRAQGLGVGLALNPATKISECAYLVDKLDMVLFLSVIPGFYGSKFIPEVLDKIKEFRSLYPKKIIGIDGGIKLDNLVEISPLGVDLVCIGSALFKAENPAEAYRKFSDTINP